MANITEAPTPMVSMSLQLSVSSGRNQIQQTIGKYAALYLAANSRILNQYLELAPGETYNSNLGETTSNLIVKASSALAFTSTTVEGNALNLNINSVLVLDDPIASYSFTNNGLSVARVNLNSVNYTNLVAALPVYYGNALQPAVYSAEFVQGLPVTVSGNKNQTITITTGLNEYAYYCYPASAGASTFTSNGFVGGMGLVATINVQTPIGILPYYVYASENPGLGAVTLIVTGG